MRQNALPSAADAADLHVNATSNSFRKTETLKNTIQETTMPGRVKIIVKEYFRYLLFVQILILSGRKIERFGF